MTSVWSNYGDFALGWKPPVRPDERNWPMGRALEIIQAGATPTQLDMALAALIKSGTNNAVKSWAKLVTALLEPAPAPVPPTPPPTPTPAKIWGDAIVLDQGNVGSCTGNAWTDLLNADPLPHSFQEDTALKIYWQAKALDGEPKVDDGTTVEQAAKATRGFGYIKSYVFAGSSADALTWVRTQGPVVFGSEWYDNMFEPNANGIVNVSGAIAGGHCYLIVGHDKATGIVTCLNSWGSGWGINGRFGMHETDFTRLFNNQGEAAAAVEVA